MTEEDLARAFSYNPPVETVPDVVCGKRVNPRATKWQIRHGEQTFYFCTLSCALRFKDSPHAFQRRIEHATQN